jgi:hypothetical protein
MQQAFGSVTLASLLIFFNEAVTTITIWELSDRDGFKFLAAVGCGAQGLPPLYVILLEHHCKLQT